MAIGIFSSILKKASVTPVFKKGDSRFLDNYMLVSTFYITTFWKDLREAYLQPFAQFFFHSK